MKNGLEIDFTDNPDLADVFNLRKEGDKFEIRICGQINQISDSGMKGTIEKVCVVQARKEKEIEPDADEPVMVVMSGGSRKGEEEPETVSDAGY